MDTRITTSGGQMPADSRWVGTDSEAFLDCLHDLTWKRREPFWLPLSPFILTHTPTHTHTHPHTPTHTRTHPHTDRDREGGRETKTEQTYHTTQILCSLVCYRAILRYSSTLHLTSPPSSSPASPLALADPGRPGRRKTAPG
jgi:hypothetical protein